MRSWRNERAEERTIDSGGGHAFAIDVRAPTGPVRITAGEKRPAGGRHPQERRIVPVCDHVDTSRRGWTAVVFISRAELRRLLSDYVWNWIDDRLLAEVANLLQPRDRHFNARVHAEARRNEVALHRASVVVHRPISSAVAKDEPLSRRAGIRRRVHRTDVQKIDERLRQVPDCLVIVREYVKEAEHQPFVWSAAHRVRALHV